LFVCCLTDVKKRPKIADAPDDGVDALLALAFVSQQSSRGASTTSSSAALAEELASHE